MMNVKTMIAAATLAAAPVTAQTTADSRRPVIGKQQVEWKSDLLTPEILWSMGRIGHFEMSPDGKSAVYAVTYFSVEQNASHTVLYRMEMATKRSELLTQTAANESDAVFLPGGQKIAFLSDASGSTQVWEMGVDGSQRRQLSDEEGGVSGFLFSPDGRKVLLVKDVPNYTSIQEGDADLPEASGMVINDLMYKHWDHYNTSSPHPFIADFDGTKIAGAKDVLEDEPYESPMKPFGGIEQFAWSPDSKTLAYTCRKKTGRDYAISTDSDIYLYEWESQKTVNLCKPDGYKAPVADPTVSLENQAVNKASVDYNVGYDQNPQFSPDGRYVAWLSMERDGYESDRTRLCVYRLKDGQKTYVTESFESGVNDFCWDASAKSDKIYFTGVWHARTQIYSTDLKGNVRQLTDDVCDYAISSLTPDGKSILATRHSISSADEVYLVTPGKKKTEVEQLTFENKAFFDKLTMGEVKERWVETVDGKRELCWVIYPPHFDASKKYPTLLYCEGGPQSPVSQFWSYRWNFQIMAANGYIVIAPNRRGLPGFGMEWLEAISGDYSGLCMQDYLSAIDDICREPYVDKDRLGCVGASFGGYSVYWLAGHHDGRFKCFIAHDGIFNTQQQYVETEEMWFPNWDMGAAPWHKDAQGRMQKVFETSPHLSVDKWDTPILCIHGQKDFRIEYTQAESAFNAARLRGIPAQLLLFPDENHWVLKPQNGVLWQRTFFRWLDRWLKK